MSILPEARRPRAAIYVRVSSTLQGAEDKYSLPTQKDACRSFAAEHGCEVDPAHVFREVYGGQYLWERPQLTRLRELVRRHEVDMVVVHEIDRLSREQWYLGGLLRSLHRYAADAFVVVTLAHVLREWLHGRYHGFRRFSWLTGVPLLGFAFVCGVVGFWLNWDQLGQFSAVASAELLDWLPLFASPTTRNFDNAGSVSDRLFSLFVFIHLGVPLLLLFPDLLMVGYAASSRVGAWSYDLAHSYPLPALLGAVATAAAEPLWQGVALIWFAHIGMDRAVGYGLKYETDFRDTHLGRIGR